MAKKARDTEGATVAPGLAGSSSRERLRHRPHPHLFQINTWAWLDRLSQALGRLVRLADVPEVEWDRLRESGFDFVYLLGLWKRSHEGRRIFRTDPASFRNFDAALPTWTMANVIGSPFSIESYEPDPRIGTWDDIGRLRDKLHDRGMGLFVDFVPNHTGPDHPWMRAHPEYYVQGSESDFRRDPTAFHLVEFEGKQPLFIARGRDPYFAPWADTSQLDYFNPGARAAMVETLRQISAHADGVRCDMAMLVLNEVFRRTWEPLVGARPGPAREFWSEAMESVPSLIWMAEVYWDMEWELQQLGFDFTYDKRLYDRLAEAAPRETRQHLQGDWQYQIRMARFLENHDEPRAHLTFGKERQFALAPLIASLPGLRFFHQGQFEGLKTKLQMPLNLAVEEPIDEELVSLYAKVLALADEPIFHDGEWRLLEVRNDNDPSGENLVAYVWRLGTELRLWIFNLGGGESQGWITLPGEHFAEPRYRLRDRMSDQDYTRVGADLRGAGLYVRLPANRAHLFEVRPA